jgi:hypothetical protein
MTQIWDDRFGLALDEAGCNLLNQVGNAAINTGVGLLALPGLQLKGAGVLAAGALVSYAVSIGCNYGAGGKSPSGGIFCDVDVSGVCMEFDQGQGKLYQRYGDDEIEVSTNYKEVISIGCETGEPDTDVDSKGYLSTYRQVVTKGLNGELFSSEQILYYTPGTIPTVYSKPLITGEDSLPDGECTVKPRMEPYETQDANGCDMTVQVIGMAETPGGKVAPIQLIEPGHQKSKWEEEKQWERETPGTIADTQPIDYSIECNFQPTIVFPDPDGAPVYVPIGPGEDIWDALKRLNDDMKNRFQEVNDDLEELNDKLDDLLDKTPDDDPVSIPAGTINFTAVCDYDQNGELKSEEYPVQGAATVSQALSAIHDLNTTLAVMIQQHLNWKTPVCGADRPELKGDYRTIFFVSDEKSPTGNDRLRKRFRYRSESSNDLGRLVDHWANFTFAAGPVCVQHSGSSVGTPQVWAASGDEGKRVIRHAFGEAGVNPDQVGKWTIGGSDNPRFGVSGTMRVCTKGGYYWITERLGSDARPLVARV